MSSTPGNELRKACVDGDLQAVQSIVQALTNQLSPDPLSSEHLQSSLAGAVSAGQPEIVSYLLSHGAQLSPLNITQAANPRCRTVGMFQTFLDHGWDINSPTDMHATALKHVVDSEELTQWFLGHGADPTADTTFSILDVAAACSSPAVLDLLIAHGARLEDSDALHAAAGECESVPGRVEVMRHLIEDLGADVDAIEQRGLPIGRGLGRGTPLHSAAYAGKAERIKLLLAEGANKEKQNTLGQTAMDLAIMQESETALEILKGEK
ncbi:MAG: hypothetical protein Q9216_005598 [Gyalolechia sp. 2 TL-2023]